MKYFNFGDYFISLTKIFFTKFTLFTQNNGYCSDLFVKQRGVNQGCNHSPFCYNVCGAIMAQLIKNNPEIQGIKMHNGVSNVITQFANDTGLFLMYSENCVNAVLSTLMNVELNTGLKVSYEKTKIYRVGSLKNSSAKCYTIKPIIWSDGDIDLLGITISSSPQQSTSDFQPSMTNSSRSPTTGITETSRSLEKLC